MIYYPPTTNGLQKTLGAALDVGATASATLNNVTGIQNKKGIMVVDRVDANGSLTNDKREYISFDGTSGSTVTTLVRGLGGSTDQDHAIGAIVEFVPDVVIFQSFIDTLAVAVNPDTGALATAIVTLTGSQTLTNKTLTTPAITTPKITTSINDSGGNEVIKTPATGSAVNEITVTNAATGNVPTVSATGGDDKIALGLTGKSAFVQASGLYDCGTVGATETVSWKNGDRQLLTMDENLTITFSNAIAGQTLTLYLLQDGSGTNSITFADTITWADATTPTWTTTANKMNIAVIFYSGSAYFGVGNKFA